MTRLVAFLLLLSMAFTHGLAGLGNMTSYFKSSPFVRLTLDVPPTDGTQVCCRDCEQSSFCAMGGNGSLTTHANRACTWTRHE
jgi:hypothetical protein